MRDAVLDHLEVPAPALDVLRRMILDEYTSESWGLRSFSTIPDLVDRAVASDLLVSSLEGVRNALTSLSFYQHRHAELLGPNGRTMPGPHTGLSDHLRLVEMDACVTSLFGALGSVLDCLAAASVLVLALPAPVQRAEGSWLLRLPYETRGRTCERQEDAWRRLSAEVACEGNSPSPGWLAWALEMRNAVLHRGTLLRVWLNRPTRPTARKLVVRTASNPATLVRMEPHLRREPWLPDMHALPGGKSADAMWVVEPAQRTLLHLRLGTLRIVEKASQTLTTAWSEAPCSGSWPWKDWRLQRRDDAARVRQAAEFTGFEPSYPTPLPSQLRLHPDSAARALLAEQVRQHLNAGD